MPKSLPSLMCISISALQCFAKQLQSSSSVKLSQKGIWKGKNLNRNNNKCIQNGWVFPIISVSQIIPNNLGVCFIAKHQIKTSSTLLRWFFLLPVLRGHLLMAEKGPKTQHQALAAPDSRSPTPVFFISLPVLQTPIQEPHQILLFSP